jgi:uncharacterized membrane protein YgcG
VIGVCVPLFATQQITSRWKDKEITVDGLIAEWTELMFVDGGISVAAFNDDRELYLAVATSDPQRRRQFLASGLLVWLDVQGGKKERFGVRLPGNGLQRPDGPPAEFPGDSPDAQPRDIPQPNITYVELLGPGKEEKRRVELAGESGIAAGAKVEEGTLLYELKIPLHGGIGAQLYAHGARMDRPVGLGLQTPKLEQRERAAGGMGGFGGSTGRGGFGGGRRGGGGGGMRGRGEGMEELKLWTTLTLARGSR